MTRLACWSVLLFATSSASWLKMNVVTDSNDVRLGSNLMVSTRWALILSESGSAGNKVTKWRRARVSRGQSLSSAL